MAPTRVRVLAVLHVVTAVVSGAAGCGPQRAPWTPAPPDPTREAIARAGEHCESGHAALERGDVETALPVLQEGVGILEALGLQLTPESADLFAMCLHDLGRVFETTSSDDPRTQPEALYGRAMAVAWSRDVLVDPQLHRWLEANGGEECTLGDVRRTESTARVFPDWLSAARALSAEVAASEEGTDFADEAEALDFLFVDRAGSESDALSEATVTTVGDDDERLAFLLVPRPDGTVLVPERLASAMGGRCPSEGDAWLAGASPPHAIGFESSSDLVYEDEEGRPCESEDESCISGCVWISHRVIHQFVDPDSGRTVTITAQVEGLDLAGDGEPYRYVQVQPFNGRLVLFGCGTKVQFEP
ncbi:MAG: hypothetical protein JXB32_11665 [Deltaproteobacteria bacterium]|nr:hypothetical protein [Deltaproteobacteria bacterium]